MATIKGRVTAADIGKIVGAKPGREPVLVGATRAAEILGIKAPNFKRYRERLTAVPVLGAADVWIRAEVEALGEELRASRGGG